MRQSRQARTPNVTGRGANAERAGRRRSRQGLLRIGSWAAPALLATSLAVVPASPSSSSAAIAASALRLVSSSASATTASPAAAGGGSAAQPGGSSSPVVEESFTAFSHRVRRADGSQSVDVTAGPSHFRDAQGHWQDIDLRAADDGAGRFRPVRAAKAHRIGKVSSGSVVTIDTSAGALTVSHADATGARSTSDGTRPGGLEVRYPKGLAGGRDLVEGFTVTGVEERVSVPDAAAGASYQVQLGLPKGATARQDSSGVLVVDRTGWAVAGVGDGLAEDAKFADTPVSVSLVSQAPGTAVLKVGIDPAWLADPARAFPVVIDPTYDELTSNNNGCAASGSTSTYNDCDTYTNSDSYDASPGYYTQTQLRSGSPNSRDQYLNQVNRTRSFIQFATDNFADPQLNVLVNNATVSVYTFGGSSTYGQTNLSGSSGPVNQYTNWRNQPGWDQGSYSTLSYSGGSGWQTFQNVTGIAQRWFTGGEVNNGVVLQASDELNPGLFRQYYSAEAGSAYAPRLHLDYTETPASVTGLSASAGNASVTGSWNAVPTSFNGGAAVDGYRVSLRDASGTVVQTTTVCGTCTSAVFSGATNGASYSVGVEAHNTRGYSYIAYSNSVVPETTPDAPQGVNAGRQDSAASVSWSPPARDGGSPISSYTTRAWDASSGGNVASSSISGCCSTTINGLANGVTYWVDVTASNAFGGGPASGRVAVTPSRPPGAPASVTATAGNASAYVSWQRPASDGGAAITGYYITPVNQSGGYAPQPTQCDSNCSQVSFSGLTNGQNYVFNVQADNVAGRGGATSSNTINPSTTPAAPAVGATAGNAQATVTWSAPDDGGRAITAYTITGTDTTYSPTTSLPTQGTDGNAR